MSELIPMLSHPVLTIDDYPGSDVIADRFLEKSLTLMKGYPDAGLISDAFHSGRRAASVQKGDGCRP